MPAKVLIMQYRVSKIEKNLHVELTISEDLTYRSHFFIAR